MDEELKQLFKDFIAKVDLELHGDHETKGLIEQTRCVSREVTLLKQDVVNGDNSIKKDIDDNIRPEVSDYKKKKYLVWTVATMLGLIWTGLIIVNTLNAGNNKKMLEQMKVMTEEIKKVVDKEP